MKVSEILAVEKNGRISIVKTKNDYFETYEPLVSIEKKLDYNFIKVSQSTIVNPLYYDELIKEDKNSFIKLKDGSIYKFSRSAYKNFRNNLAKLSLKDF